MDKEYKDKTDDLTEITDTAEIADTTDVIDTSDTADDTAAPDTAETSETTDEPEFEHISSDELERTVKPFENLFYLCGLIEEVCRQTKNTKKTVADRIEADVLRYLYDKADTWYRDKDFQQAAEDVIDNYFIKKGRFNNVSAAKYDIPGVWTMGLVYAVLAENVAEQKHIYPDEALWEIYHSFVCDELDNYNSLLYCEAPENLLLYYTDGYIGIHSGMTADDKEKIAWHNKIRKKLQ